MARTEVDSLVLTMSADIRRMEKALNQARGQTDRQLKAIEARFSKMNAHVVQSGDQMSNDLRRSIAAIGLTAAVSEVTRYADAWTTAANKLSAAGVAQRDLADTQARLVQLALQTRTDLGATVDLYARITRSTQAYGVTADQATRATEILNKAFKAGGAVTTEQTAAIIQLGQALGSGMLQGDELRTLRESAPLLAKAIADEFGTTIAGLKELGAEGKLTTDRIFNGILKAGVAIDAQFATTKSTVADAFTNLQTAATQYLGTVDQNLGVSEKFVGLIQQIASNLDLFAAAAVATVAVLGGRGLAGAVSGSNAGLKSFLTTIVENARAASALRKTAAIDAAKELRNAQSILSVEEDRLAVAQFRVNQARLAATISSTATQAEAKAFAALQAAQSAVALEQARGLIGTGRAWDKYRDALDSFGRTSATAKTQMDALVAAEGEYNRRLIQHQAALTNVTQGTIHATTTAARATPVMRGLSAAFAGLNTFLASPVGTIALIAALTFGMQQFGKISETTADIVADVEEGLQRLKAVRTAIGEDTAKLEAANVSLTEAIEAQGAAAEATARLEIDAISRRIAKNKELATLYEAQARSRLADAEAANVRERQQEEYRLLDITEFNKNPNPGGQTFAEYLAARSKQIVARQDAGQLLTDVEREILKITVARGQREAEIDNLKSSITSLGKATGAQSLVPTTGGGAGDEKSRLRGYTTALEEFNSALKEIRASTEDEATKSRAAVQALLDYASASKDVASAFEILSGSKRADTEETQAATKALDDYVASLHGATKGNIDLAKRPVHRNKDGSISTVRSLSFEENGREILVPTIGPKGDLLSDDQAIDRYRRTGEHLGKFNNAAEADRYAELLHRQQELFYRTVADLPTLADILTGDDDALVKAELSKLVFDTAEGLATGANKIHLAFQKAEIEILQAIAAAEAAGLTGTVQQLMEDLNALRAEYIQDLQDLNPDPYDAATGGDPPAIDTPEFEDELAALREGIRQGLRSGLREGIESDNWGLALRKVIAEAATGGFDDALDRFADALTDILTGRNEFVNGLVGSVFGARAAGGGASARGAYRVNEGGSKNKEFLFMGSNPGQVLRASEINKMVAGGKGGGATTIDARMTVMGSIDAVTWPKLERAMQMQAQQILRAVPGAVNATIIDNRVQQRRI